MTESFTYLGYQFEVRQPDEDDAIWEWRAVGGQWRAAPSYAVACCMCGGHARLAADADEVARAI